MKILEVIPFFHPAYGGPVGVVRALTKALVERGHEVTIYTSDAFAGSPKSRTKMGTVRENGIKICYFKDISYNLTRNHHLFFSPSMLAVAKREIKYFDIIHLQDYRNFHNIIVHHYARKFKVPYILEPHGSFPRMITKQWLKKIYDTFWGYRLFRDACKIIAITPVEANQIEKAHIANGNIVILPNGIDLSEYKYLPERGRFRQRYGIGDRQRILLFLGRINVIKGLDTLVTAFAHLTKEITDLKLVIAGPDDGYLSQLKHMIKELGISNSTLLTGPLYNQQKREAYVDSDIFILPSNYEIFGITVLEACASGVPVILTEQCGIAPWIMDGKSGLTFPAGNIHLLKTDCCCILNNKPLAKFFGENGKQMVKTHFNLSNIAFKIEDVYNSCLEQK